MATSKATNLGRCWQIDWRGTSAEWQAFRLDLVSDQAQGVVIGWTAFHLPGDVIRCLVTCQPHPVLSKQ